MINIGGDRIEDVNGMCTECQESINEAIDKLKYYRTRPDEHAIKNPPFSSRQWDISDFDKKIEEAPQLVSDIYNEYKRNNKLLEIDESESGPTSAEKERFKENADEHLDFLRELREKIFDAKDNNSDLSSLEEEVCSRISNSTESLEILAETEEELNMMPRQQTVYFVLYELSGRRDELYYNLLEAYPKHTDKIKQNINRVDDVRNVFEHPSLSVLLNIDEEDVEYIREYANSEITKTLEQYRKEER